MKELKRPLTDAEELHIGGLLLGRSEHALCKAAGIGAAAFAQGWNTGDDPRKMTPSMLAKLMAVKKEQIAKPPPKRKPPPQSATYISPSHNWRTEYKAGVR